MSYCPKVVKAEKCEEEEKSEWSSCLQSTNCIFLTGAAACTGIAALTKKHRWPWVGAVAVAAAAFPIISGAKEREESILQRFSRPCTTIFDTYRFTTHPVCYTMPREKPLVFYSNEPDKPITKSSWTENFAYDNVPKPDCCKKGKVQAAVSKDPFRQEDYGNLPSKGQCPK